MNDEHHDDAPPQVGPSKGALGGLGAMLVVAAGILGVAFTGGGDGGGGTTTTVAGEPIVIEASGGTRIADADVNGLARQMTEGLAAGDFETYAAAFDFDTDELARARQLFDNLKLLPLSRLDMVALDFNARAFNSSGGKVKTTAEIAMVHQFEGADPRPVAEAYELDLVRDSPEAEIRVVEMRGAEAGGSLYPQPWDQGPIHVASAERAIVLGAAEDAALIDQRAAAISAGAGAALDELAGRDPRPFPRRVVIVVPGPGKDVYDVFFGDSSSSVREAAGVAADQLTAPYEDIEGNRIEALDEIDTFQGAGRVAIDRTHVRDGGAFLTAVSRHETAHLIQYAWRPGREATRVAFDAGENTWAVDDLPRWITEGFAEYVGHGYLAGGTSSGEYRLALAAARRGERLPNVSANAFYEGTSEQVNARYGLGMTAFMYVEATKGRDVALAWGHALFNAPSLEAVARTYRDVLGTTREQFEAGWYAWVRSRG